MMKECARIKRIVSAYLDKETGESDNTLVRAHLEKCPVCSKEVKELSRVKGYVMEKERRVLPPDHLVSRLRQEIASQRQSDEESVSWLAGMARFSLRLIPVPVTAIVLAAAFLFSGTPQAARKYSLEDTLLNGRQATVETALGLVLGTVD